MCGFILLCDAPVGRIMRVSVCGKDAEAVAGLRTMALRTGEMSCPYPYGRRTSARLW